MMNKQTGQQDMHQDMHPEAPAETDQSQKVGLKQETGTETDPKKGNRWKKVSALFDEAQKAYMEGSGFAEVIATLIETLKNLAKSEVPHALGGLGINDGPEMDLSPEEAPAEETPPKEQQ